MRIFYAADHEPFPGNNLWHNNLYLPLVDLGHLIIPFDYILTPHFMNCDPAHPAQREFIEQRRPALEKALLQQIEAEHRRQKIDAFFSYFYSAFCRPEVIRAIREMGICTINWYCNASYQFHLVQEIAPAYDYCLVPEKFRLDDYRRAGANPIYCQEAANPNIYKPHNLPLEYDVTFVGQRYGDRPFYIKHLLDHHVQVRVWGLEWQSKHSAARRIARRIIRTLQGRAAQLTPDLPAKICGAPLSDEELIEMYSRSKISLGFSNVGNTHLSSNPIQQVRLRDFEAPMSGAFYMVQAFDELAEFFEPGKEVVFFGDKQDLLEKARYYLKHDAERKVIQQAGLRRARAQHTWQKRFQSVFKEIGLS